MRFSHVIGCLSLLVGTNFSSAAELVRTQQASGSSSASVAQAKLLKVQQRKLLLQVRRQIAALPPLPEPSPDDSEALQSQRTTRRQLVSRLEEIETKIKIQESPRTRFALSGKAAPGLEEYYQRLKTRIESAANEDFPKENKESIYGRVNVSFTLSAQGRIESIEILSSTSDALVTYSKSLLKGLEPFEPFPASLAKKVDHIVVESPFDFLSDK